MTELKAIIDFVQGIGFVGLLILLAVPKSRKLLGFDVDATRIADEIRKDFEYDLPDRPILIKRIPVICLDMKAMRNDLNDLKEDVSYIKGRLDK